MTTLSWQQGTIEQVVALSQRIPEFDQPYGAEVYRHRLASVPHLIQIGYSDGEAAGFKVGYALSDDTFYSWMGGVLPQGRGTGMAQHLLEAQESWAVQQGYSLLQVKSRNRYPAMLRLLLRNGYQITRCEDKGEGTLDHRIHFEKTLKN
ncbi:GNAT family N-acetyltransferase [Ferrimonas marina]|uniref:N-acetyltransferase domain-containing protein n=1 Tax=Ferrimonas marina TaxID=299255 RepID=A0A1M5XRH0_9GAMM|nr:GNAT family N-acetyltransferase [Ferrimonas marina]SHI01863.1 hypothetical protein SAMN02745129_3594 [Ferrimonas marina]